MRLNYAESTILVTSWGQEARRQSQSMYCFFPCLGSFCFLSLQASWEDILSCHHLTFSVAVCMLLISGFKNEWHTKFSVKSLQISPLFFLSSTHTFVKSLFPIFSPVIDKYFWVISCWDPNKVGMTGMIKQNK